MSINIPAGLVALSSLDTGSYRLAWRETLPDKQAGFEKELGMTFYVGMVDKSSDGFGVWFPDLPGCTSMGTTTGELFTNGTQAVRIWIEDAIIDGEALPRSRDVAELLNDPEVRTAIRDDNASFIQIPLLLDRGRSARANISIDAGLLEAVDDAAKQRGVTRSAFLASAARDKIARGP